MNNMGKLADLNSSFILSNQVLFSSVFYELDDFFMIFYLFVNSS